MSCDPEYFVLVVVMGDLCLVAVSFLLSLTGETLSSLPGCDLSTCDLLTGEGDLSTFDLLAGEDDFSTFDLLTGEGDLEDGDGDRFTACLADLREGEGDLVFRDFLVDVVDDSSL